MIPSNSRKRRLDKSFVLRHLQPFPSGPEQGLSFFEAEAGTAARRFLYSSIFWLLLPGAFGLVLASLLYVPRAPRPAPDGGQALSELRPAEANACEFDGFRMAFDGLLRRHPLYLAPAHADAAL